MILLFKPRQSINLFSNINIIPVFIITRSVNLFNSKLSKVAKKKTKTKQSKKNPKKTTNILTYMNMPTFYSVSNFDFAKRLFYKAIHKPNQNKVNKKKLLVAASHKSVILKALKKFKSLALGTFCQWKIVNIRYLASLLVHTSLLSIQLASKLHSQFIRNSLLIVHSLKIV